MPREEWEDRIPDDWPFDEEGEWIEDQVDEYLESWDEIDEVDDYKYVEGEDGA